MLFNRRDFIKIILGLLVSSSSGLAIAHPEEFDSKEILLVYWLVSITQPTKTDFVIKLIKMLDDLIWQDVSKKEIVKIIKFLETQDYILAFKTNSKVLFSINPRKNFKLTPKERLNRDRLRFYFLKATAFGKKNQIMGGRKGYVDGDPPSPEERPPIQLRVGIKGRQSQPLKPLEVSLLESTSYAVPPLNSELSPHHYPLSYPDDNFISRIKISLPEHMRVRYILALDIGFSPQLITRIISNKNHYYRNFKIRKKNGGSREVSSPRTYLKVILRYINTHLFSGLRVHNSVHSYRSGRSSITNAKEHIGKKFVLNIDLENYFSSISSRKIISVLRDNGFSRYGSILLASLCTLDGVLPQGAPTSPLISNVILFRIDGSMFKYCKKRSLNYTRYSDDITISGNSKEAIQKAKKRLTVMVEGIKFKINYRKTRLMPYHKQQIVTGVVVNENPTPPRKVMRRIRAKFHEADKAGSIDLHTFKRLYGHISYLNAFDKYRNCVLVEKYIEIIKNVKVR